MDVLRRTLALDVEDGALRVILLGEVGNVPQATLPHRGVQADLEHVAHLLRAVDAAAVPQAVVSEDERARRAHHMLLPDDVLIAPDGALAHHPQVRAGDVAGAAHGRRHRVREVHQLDVEGAARIDGGVLMRVLRHAGRAAAETRRIGDVQEMVIEQRARAH